MSKQQKEVNLHALMCLTGGFAGTYSLLRCHENFGAAQTANLIFAVRTLLGGSLSEFLLRILGLMVYMAAILLFVFIRRRTRWDERKWVILTQSICLLIVGLIPSDRNDFLCLYPLFFMLAAQWSVFHGTEEFNASTIFSSNNVKQFTLAIGEYMLEHTKTQSRKARFFGMTLLTYHLGVTGAVVGYHFFAQYSIFLCYIPVAAAAVFLSLKEKQSAGRVRTGEAELLRQYI